MENTVLLVTNNGMGKADENLQLLLFSKYLELLLQNEELPAALCFYTDGVKLVCEGRLSCSNYAAWKAKVSD